MFNPDALDTESRRYYDAVIELPFVSTEQWVGAAMSALNMIANDEELKDVERDAMLHVLYTKAPAEVTNLGTFYDAGLLTN
jgi:hypothetical protein